MMRKLLSRQYIIAASAVLFVFLYSCDKNKEDNGNGTQLRIKEYSLEAVEKSGINGKVTISENSDKSFNVLVSVDSSVKDTVHFLRINNGSILNPGKIAIPLTDITGTGTAAQSLTPNIVSVLFPDNIAHTFTYDSIVNFDGYVNVLYSASHMDSVISHGNIGGSSN